MQRMAGNNLRTAVPGSRHDATTVRIIRSQRCTPPNPPVRIGLALGGGFARGIAHAGVLRVFQQHHIPIHCITGISAGAIVASAIASGASVEHIIDTGCSMRLNDIARFRFGRMGIVSSDRMHGFLQKLLQCYRFEEMRIPLGIVATDLADGQPVSFSAMGTVFDPIRASCAYPGLFEPVRHLGKLLVDGVISMGIPAEVTRRLGATHVISVCLPSMPETNDPRNMVQVLNRCLQNLQNRACEGWRNDSNLVITPEVAHIDWNGFGRGKELVEAGERAAQQVIPEIQRWLAESVSRETIN